jgi:peptide/nickel transport system permease protein
VVILAAANFGYVVLTLAALGFVGLGAQIPTPEWGAMITDGQQFILSGAWWIALFPGLGVLVVATAANIIADTLRDVFDPTTIGSPTGSDAFDPGTMASPTGGELRP